MATKGDTGRSPRWGFVGAALVVPLVAAGALAACGDDELRSDPTGTPAAPASTGIPAPPPPPGAPPWAPNGDLDAYPHAPPPSTAPACAEATPNACGETRRSALPVTIGTCRWGMVFELRDTGPTLCEYFDDAPDAGGRPASELSWSCWTGLPVGEPLTFPAAYSYGFVNVSGSFTVRFEAAGGGAGDAGDAGDASAGDASAPLVIELTGCFDTSSGTGR